jgi:hypothetical protein
MDGKSPALTAGLSRRCPLKRWSRSDAAAPISTPTVRAPFDVLFVTLERRVLWQPHFLGGRIEAFAGVGCLFNFI